MEKILRSVNLPVFLVRSRKENGSTTLEVHTTKAARRSVGETLKAALVQNSISNLTIQVHGHADFFEPRSLQSLESRFGQGAIVYDPTGAFGRIEEYTACAKAMRAAAGDRISGIFMEPINGAMYVVPTVAGTGASALVALQNAVEDISTAVGRWAAARSKPAGFQVVAMVEQPRGFAVVPVDTMTAREFAGASVLGSLGVKVAAFLAAMGLAASATTAHAYQPAQPMDIVAGQGATASIDWYAPSTELFNAGDAISEAVAKHSMSVRLLETDGLRKLAAGEALPSGGTVKIAPATIAFASLTDTGNLSDPQHIETLLEDVMGPRMARAISSAAMALLEGSDLVKVAQVNSGGYGGSIGGSDNLN